MGEPWNDIKNAIPALVLYYYIVWYLASLIYFSVDMLSGSTAPWFIDFVSIILVMISHNC